MVCAKVECSVRWCVELEVEVGWLGYNSMQGDGLVRVLIHKHFLDNISRMFTSLFSNAVSHHRRSAQALLTLAFLSVGNHVFTGDSAVQARISAMPI